MKIRFLVLAMLFVLVANVIYAQSERKHIRRGNKQYTSQNFTDAEVEYLRALERDSSSYEAKFNIANTLYKQNKFDKAAQMSQSILRDSVNVGHLPAALYNMGNTLFQMKDYDNAIEAYKNSLRIDPNDKAAKFNLAYAQYMKQQNEQQQQQQNQDNQNQDQNKDQQDNQDKQDQKDNQQDKNDNKDQQNDQKDNQQDKQDNQDQNDKKNQQQQQDNKSGMTKEEAERLLNAVQVQEDKTQEKVRKGKEVPVKVLKFKNW